MASGVRSLLDTVLEALPQVGNLGLLFLLLFFIYSCMGIQLFGTIECSKEYPCFGLGKHANFENLGSSMLTLFRIATGDDWKGILKDTLRSYCDESEPCQKNCCVSKFSAPVYFLTFVIIAQFVLLNVVVAVLMKHLKESKDKLEASLTALELEEKFKKMTHSARQYIMEKSRRGLLAVQSPDLMNKNDENIELKDFNLMYMNPPVIEADVEDTLQFFKEIEDDALEDEGRDPPVIKRKLHATLSDGIKMKRTGNDNIVPGEIFRRHSIGPIEYHVDETADTML